MKLAKTTAQKPAKRRNPYDSMDPLTQSKFLYDLHTQLGNRITRAEAYKEAVEIAQENEADRKRLGLE